MSAHADQPVDVAVIGLGVMGSMALWRCATAGLSAVGIEQFDVGHARGSSHGHSRLFRVTCLEGPAYTRLATRALPLWRELETVTGRPLLTQTGGLMIGPPGSNVVRGSLASAEDAGVPVEVLSAEELRSRYPQFPVEDDEVAVLDEQAGMLDAEGAVLAAAGAARARGARIASGAPVTRIDGSAVDVVEVHVGDDVIRARHIVLAAGPWTGSVLGIDTDVLAVRREVMAWFRPRSGHEADYLPNRFPIFVRALPDGPGAWGCGVLGDQGVKAVRERSGDDAHDPRDISMALQPQDGERSADFVRSYLPGLDPSPSRRQTCMTTQTPDHDFVIGRLLMSERTTVLAGFSGHGFKHAPAIGEIAAELAAGGESTFDLTPFAPSRFDL